MPVIHFSPSDNYEVKTTDYTFHFYFLS